MFKSAVSKICYCPGNIRQKIMADRDPLSVQGDWKKTLYDKVMDFKTCWKRFYEYLGTTECVCAQ